MDTQNLIKTVVCPTCHSVLSLNWAYCPECGQRMGRRVGGKTKENRKGWKWCPRCCTNRLKKLDVWDPELHSVDAHFCHACGTKLEEMDVVTEECPACPTCNGPSRKLKMMEVTIIGNPPRLEQVYGCKNHKCEMAIPYPKGDVYWGTEFVVVGGKKHLVRPTASEF